MSKRLSALMLLIAALAFGLVACGDDEETGGDGESASTADQEPVAQIDSLTGENTQVTFDKGFVDALTELGLTPGPVGDAEFVMGGGAAQFPITGGNVTYYDPSEPLRPYVQGILEHEGSGLSLAAKNGPTVELTDFTIDPGDSTLTGNVSADGETAAEGALLFNLDGTTLEPLKMEGDAAVLEGTTVELSQDAADLLNETFGVDALKEGFVVGESKITVTG